MPSHSQAQHASPGDRPQPGTVEVGHHEPGLAVVSMHGEHDLSTVPKLRPTFEQATAHSNVLVDLSDCAFIDSTVIGLLIRAAMTVQARDEQFVLVIPPEQAQVARVAETAGLTEIFPIHLSRDVALANLKLANDSA